MTQEATGLQEPFRKYLEVLAELHLDGRSVHKHLIGPGDFENLDFA